MSVLGITLAGWLAAAVCVEFCERVGVGQMSFAYSIRRAIGLPRAAWGMTTAHFGLAIVVAGITGASLWEVESIQVMRPGEKIEVSGYEFTFEGARQIQGPNYTAERGTFRVKHQGEVLTVLEPERRRYIVSGQDTTEAAIRTTAMYDLYAVLGESNGKGAWTTRLYYKPLVPWIWIGSLVMVFGGIVSLSDRRLRIGAPARRSKVARISAAAAE